MERESLVFCLNIVLVRGDGERVLFYLLEACFVEVRESGGVSE